MKRSLQWEDSVLTWNTVFTLIIPYGIIFLLSVIGNSLVIATLTLNRSMRSVTNIFLLNLAIADLLLGVFCMPFTLIGVLLKRFIFGRIMCHLVSYCQGKLKLPTFFLLSLFFPSLSLSLFFIF